ncbi:hypothetical protein RO3G_15155 [Rhizopus delemar RA 99-880]|uniref:Uncharacterized protein n=1 Tax=Rhizopus delemar (strain RA 99-880 / ATCC MYA-4621 / FGSC 9543 / NRRL 43880) TaxID=246409 RepID=I1CPR4_RHIO9|nr:hypothetical protein RO3G_15155 [Rhizopus delemar RA 99-880]|eukprot:EIE90444.1 hypothetical protein RO3G_15155 [Rhizopus delemar RA 99-880]
MTFLLINRFVTLETNSYMHAIGERHSNHVKSEKNCDGNRLGRIKIHYFKHTVADKTGAQK